MSEPLPWYKHFWPWFIVVLLLGVIIKSLVALNIAIDNADSLVSDDYYKEGKAINMDLRKIKQAKNLGMQFLVKVEEHQLIITQHGGPQYKAALQVSFIHPTLEDKDFNVNATADGTGAYRIALSNAITGPWNVRLEGFDNSWRIQQRVVINDDVEYWLN
ncbi:FixH family protein [Shewanella intestini]|uniref:FixH family protein n=1 Tax=Shewanella intestini TaxID=2017544 RepID=A0ABS5HZT6_9GAMM|nr:MULTISPECIES: FixH family protein [Shewanella]MBR9727276.1 FixH family protein [Shewanella intestini]MRG36078.1 cytochrome C oxidase Cbb3 [Shewanella sp. XMDDZSB0408]